jgi:hypothetical protein
MSWSVVNRPPGKPPLGEAGAVEELSGEEVGVEVPGAGRDVLDRDQHRL